MPVEAVCSKCGRVRKVYPRDIARLKTGLCRECWYADIRARAKGLMRLTCSKCGKVREVRPSAVNGVQYKTGLCLLCYRAAPKQRKKVVVKLTCSKCGKVRWTTPSLARRHKTELCQQCSFAGLLRSQVAQHRAARVKSVCPRCGRIRFRTPAEATVVTTEFCQRCFSAVRKRRLVPRITSICWRCGERKFMLPTDAVRRACRSGLCWQCLLAVRRERGVSRGCYVSHRDEHGRKQHEHRQVAEHILGRVLRRGEHVHHINEDRTDNRPENLVVLPTRGHHTRWHQWVQALAREAARAAGVSVHPPWRAGVVPPVHNAP